MTYDSAFFDKGINRSGTNSVKWGARDVMQEGIIPLWVADMDFAAAEPIRQALIKRAEHASYGYTYAGPEDMEALAGFWRRRHKTHFTPEMTLMLPTVVAGLRACVNTLTQAGDGVIIQTPVYGPFSASVRENGRVVMDAELLRGDDGRYRMNFDAIERFLNQGARLMILCNPHNPVSRAWSQEELRALIVLLKRYKARLVSDEIHADFVYAPKEFTSILSLPEAAEDTISLVSASKTFNVAGLQQATAVCRDADTLSMLSRFLERNGIHSGNIFALAATRAAYNECDDWLDSLLSYLGENRTLLRQLLEGLLPRATLTPIEATYLAWVDIRPYEDACHEIGSRCKKHGVALTNGQFFGKGAGDGFMRLNFGCPKAQLTEGVHRFAKAIKEG